MSGEGSPFDVPPAAFGRFRVLHQIGTGSLGPVFRGEDSETREPVAIKLLHLKIGPERTRIIADELQALVGTVPQHPNLTRVIAAGLSDDTPYVVSQLAPGESLDLALREYGPAVMADALPRLWQLADALDHAARQGLWHGALHPRDIVVSADATGLTGLGIAPVLERAGVRPEPRPPYTAPEVLERRPTTPSADQYALAAVAHEWLFGRRASGAAETLLEVPALPGVDADTLAGALTSALAPDPADRFSSCTAFVDALANSIRGGGSSEPPLTAAQRASPAKVPAPTLLPFDLDEPSAAACVPDEQIIAVAPPERSIADLHFDPEPQPFPPGSALSLDAGDVLPRELESPVRWSGTLAAVDYTTSGSAVGGFRIGTLVAVLIGGIVLGVVAGYVLARVDDTSEVAGGERPDLTDAPMPTTPSASPSPQQGAATLIPQRAPEPVDVPTRTSAVNADVAPAARVETARLLVRSTPSGASVTIDGTSRGMTPLTLRDLELGTRTVVVARPGYAIAERRVTLTADRPSRSIEVALAPVAGTTRPMSGARTAPASTGAASGSLLVDSRPASATVTIDGRPSGTTPLTIAAITPGTHTVRIERVGYKPWTTTIEIKAGERSRVAASLVGGQGQE